MSTLQNKRILLGVTGGIAAYKSADLVRRLQDAGAEVRVVMTHGAQQFVTPLTFQALSGYPVHTDLLDPEAEAGMGHIQLAKWADVLLIAPATADVIAKLAQGLADDLLSTISLAAAAPILIAPAMNQQMWAAQSTQANLQILKNRGLTQLGPAAGSQACGDVGEGRMLEPLAIVTAVAEQFQSGVLAGQHVVITAGPTREAIDPVRYISNHSSGKMGYAVAEAAIEAGAKVTLVSGPTQLACPDRVARLDVTSAQAMYDAVMKVIGEANIFIGTAAVADYTIAEPADQKIKKTADQDDLTLHLKKTKDILASVAALPTPPFTLGFAAETQDLETYARGKLTRKKLNMIAANRVDDPALGFNTDDNALHVFWPEGEQFFPRASKTQLARALISLLAVQFAKT